MSEQTINQNQKPESLAPALPTGGLWLRASAGIRNPKLTVELGLYAVIVALALAVRLFRLGLAPLSTGEAQLALAAWRGTLPPAGASPLLTWLNAILFAVAESNDAVARLMSALVGSALVMLPFFLRERIGRVGALGAAAMLAISPVAIMASRTASGDMLVAFVSLGLAIALDRYLQTERAGWLYTGAVLLGVGLTSGRTIYSALVTLLIGVGLIAALASDEARAKWQIIRKTPGLTGRLAIVLVAVFLASATALAWQPRGLGSAADLLSAWLADFPTGNTGVYWPLQVLAVYEALVIVMGILGLFMALQRGSQFGVFAVMWSASALILAVLRLGRTNGDVLLVVIPLTLLAGYAFEALADSFRATRFRTEEAVLILILMPVIAYFVLGLAGVANNSLTVASSIGSLNLGPAAQMIPPLLAVALATILIALFGTLSGTELAVRGATLAIVAVLAMAMWSAGCGAAQVRPDDPREIITGPETASLDVRDLMHDLALLSADKTTDVTSLPLVVQSSADGVLGWYMRNMPNAHFVTSVEELSAPFALITTSASPALAGSYAGHRYTVLHEWRLEGKPANEVLKWLVYRTAEIPQPTQQAVLWVKQGP